MARTRTTAVAKAQFDGFESAILVSGLWLFCVAVLVYTGIRSIM